MKFEFFFVTGTIVWKLLSLLSYGIFVTMIVHCSIILHSNISSIITDDFDDSILKLPSLALRVFILMVPFCCWSAGKHLRTHLMNWHEFQVNLSIINYKFTSQWLVNNSIYSSRKFINYFHFYL